MSNPKGRRYHGKENMFSQRTNLIRWIFLDKMIAPLKFFYLFEQRKIKQWKKNCHCIWFDRIAYVKPKKRYSMSRHFARKWENRHKYKWQIYLKMKLESAKARAIAIVSVWRQTSHIIYLGYNSFSFLSLTFSKMAILW